MRDVLAINRDSVNLHIHIMWDTMLYFAAPRDKKEGEIIGVSARDSQV
jgi:hypothetical protein